MRRRPPKPILTRRNTPRADDLRRSNLLRDLHDELDRLVADAYDWPWPMETDGILARLIALHDERVEEDFNEEYT